MQYIVAKKFLEKHILNYSTVGKGEGKTLTALAMVQWLDISLQTFGIYCSFYNIFKRAPNPDQLQFKTGFNEPKTFHQPPSLRTRL